ncbi:MAG: EAL domain-containing protein [Nitrosomonas sp.]|nr:MAG: EAL domain-containing protein [Nitrosomonas sp.]
MSQKETSKTPTTRKNTNDVSFFQSAHVFRHVIKTHPPIVGIAASADEVSALTGFFSHMPAKSGLAFVVITGSVTWRYDELHTLLRSQVCLEVLQATDSMKIMPDCIYLLPPGQRFSIRGGALRTVKHPRTPQLPADSFFRALALAQRDWAIGVVLSGEGIDGIQGFQTIKKYHGQTFAQDPRTCQASGIPKRAVAAACVDVIGQVEELPGMIITALEHHQTGKPDHRNRNHPLPSGDVLSQILLFVYLQTGHAFSHYRQNTICQCIEKRVQQRGLNNITDYLHFLHKNPKEVSYLFDELQLNTTGFFRDPIVWNCLRNSTLPSFLQQRAKNSALRIWIPACATGEEAYCVAILIKEIIGTHNLRHTPQIQIFATDWNRTALIQAKQGCYPSTISKHVSPERLERFFHKKNDGYQIKDDIRTLVAFTEHNITKNAPFSKLDLLFCRNLLTYLDKTLHEQLILNFHTALNPGGLLVLGTTEDTGQHEGLFIPIDDHLSIYQRSDNPGQPQAPKQPRLPHPIPDNARAIKSNLLYESGTNTIPAINHNMADHPAISHRPMCDENLATGATQRNPVNSPNDITGTHSASLPNPATIESLMVELKAAREELRTARNEAQASHSDHNKFHAANDDLYHANKRLHFTGSGLSDFKQKLLQATEQLRLTNTELITYIQAIGELGLVSVADRSGKIIEANDRFCQISEYSRDELVGQNHSMLKSGKHSKAFFVEMWKTITDGRIWHKEICNRAKSGKLYWVDSVIVPLNNPEGRIERYISIRVDVSSRKQKEIQLQQQLKEKSCLYTIHREMVKETSLQKLCGQIIKHLVSTLHYPEIAACSINLFNDFFASDNFHHDLTHALTARIKVNGKICGQLRVIYTEHKPFILPDEQNLINFIAEDLGIWYERRNHEQHINHMVCHDVLTGLPNRLLLQDRITKALEFNQRHHGMTAVLFIDLDNFKNINDTFGHNLGDLLLKKVAKRLSTSIRSEDTVARQGGDEFIVVLPHFTELNVVELVSQKILSQVSEPYHISRHAFYITCSIGIALYPEHGKSADALLKHSDTAMYHAKSSGRNSYRYFSDEMNLQAIENHRITNYLYSAIKNNELQLYFQPIVNNENTIVSLEILLRWQHSQEGWISPARFIPLAEESGLILPLGDWIIKSACLQIKSWLSDGYTVPKIALNLSAKQFQHKAFLPNLQHILHETGVESQNLILEITESLLMKDNDLIQKTLAQLCHLGFTIAIDDFGTGYSNLAYLKHYPIDKLKIDRSFIRDITTDENDAAIVTATIGMAHSLGMVVVAEGVETEKQLAFLNGKGCDLYQGFYFGVPVSSAKITRLLHSERI